MPQKTYVSTGYRSTEGCPKSAPALVHVWLDLSLCDARESIDSVLYGVGSLLRG